MINAKELRIGSRVEYRNEIAVVVNISERHIGLYLGLIEEEFSRRPNKTVVSVDEISPVELTEEILLKCGFEKKGDNWYDLKFKISDCESNEMFFGGLESDICLFTEGYFSSNSVKYLHQLQNLYFAITGKEIEAI